MNNKLYFKCLQLASGHYLSTNIPNNWYDLTEDQQNEFLIENNWEPFENYDPEYVWGCIESAAKVTYEFIKDLDRGGKGMKQLTTKYLSLTHRH